MDLIREIEKLKDRMSKQESLITSLINSINIDKGYNKADLDANRINTSANTSGVVENGNCILDVANLADENSSAIEDIAVLVDDLEQQILSLKEG